MAKRPSFTQMAAHFAAIYGSGSVLDVGKKIGGKVGENIDLGVKDPKVGFTNACAIRMSYSLNYSGVLIAPNASWSTVSGGDKKWYIFRVRDMLSYLQQKFGKPDKTAKNPKPADFSGIKGILAFRVSGWSDASGHATLWDGTGCSDHCYFPQASEASLWILK